MYFDQTLSNNQQKYLIIMNRLFIFLSLRYQLYHYIHRNSSSNLDIKIKRLLCKIDTYIIHKTSQMQNYHMYHLMNDHKKSKFNINHQKVILFDHF